MFRVFHFSISPSIHKPHQFHSPINSIWIHFWWDTTIELALLSCSCRSSSPLVYDCFEWWGAKVQLIHGISLRYFRGVLWSVIDINTWNGMECVCRVWDSLLTDFQPRRYYHHLLWLNVLRMEIGIIELHCQLLTCLFHVWLLNGKEFHQIRRYHIEHSQHCILLGVEWDC